MPHNGETPCDVNVICIPLKSTFNGLQFHSKHYEYIFIRLAVVASQICEIPLNSERIRTYSNSRSSNDPRSSILASIESA